MLIEKKIEGISPKDISYTISGDILWRNHNVNGVNKKVKFVMIENSFVYETHFLESAKKALRRHKEISAELDGSGDDIPETKMKALKAEQKELKSRFNVGRFLEVFRDYLSVLMRFDPVAINSDYFLLKRREDGINGFSGKHMEMMLEMKNMDKDDIISYVEPFLNGSIEYKYKVRGNIPLSILTQEDIEYDVLEKSDVNFGRVDNVVAPVSPNILASLVVTGSVGSNTIEIIDRNNEPIIVKNILMLETVSSQVLINGKRSVETTYRWTPKIKVFNKIRREFYSIDE